MNYRLLVIALLVSLVAGAMAQKAPARRPTSRAAQAATSSNDEQELVDLEKHLFDFVRAKNSKDIEPWIAEDFSFSDAAGAEMTREQFLDNVKNFPGNIDWLSADNMRIRVFGNVAVVTGVQQRRVSQGDVDLVAKPGGPPPVTTNSAFTDVFRRRGSDWELVQRFVGELGQKKTDEAPAAAPADSESRQDTQPKPDEPPKIARPPASKPPEAR